MIGGPESSSELDGFIARWNFDEEASTFLHGLDEAILEKIIADFDPRGDTRDVTRKMYAFAKSVVDRHGNQGDEVPEAQVQYVSPEMDFMLADFAEKWNLDDDAVSWLITLPEHVARILVDEFDPKEDTRDILGKMRGFARSVQQGNHRKGLHGFAKKWGVEERALQMLQSMPQDVQATVIAEFDPKDDTRNMTGKILGFARSVAERCAKDDVLSQFVNYWRLDGPTTAMMQELPKEARMKVINEFDPKAGTRDINGKLRMFAKGVLSSKPVAMSRSRPEDPTRRTALSNPLNRPFFSSNTENLDEAIHNFAHQFGLDRSTVEWVESLPDDVRDVIFKEFDPRGNTVNIGGKLKAFATTVIERLERGEQKKAPALSEDEQFLRHWGMETSHIARETLSRLDDHAAGKVMREFLPGQDTRDIVGKFCGFANSVANTGTFLHSGQEGRSPQGGFPPRHSSRPPPSQHADDFAEQWMLSEASRALLYGLTADVQAVVIAEFDPRGDTRNIDGKFNGFVRSVSASRSGGYGGQKRPLGDASSSRPMRSLRRA